MIVGIFGMSLVFLCLVSVFPRDMRRVTGSPFSVLLHNLVASVVHICKYGMLTHPHSCFFKRKILLTYHLCEGCGNCINGLGLVDTVFLKNFLSVSCQRYK